MTDEDVKALLGTARKKGQNQRDLVRQQYIDYLKQYQPGDWVSVNLEEGEQRFTIKNRLSKAAAAIDWELKFARSRGAIKFEIVEKTAEPKPKTKKGDKRVK
jgi:hypothetical protein